VIRQDEYPVYAGGVEAAIREMLPRLGFNSEELEAVVA
jgi:hypothetical protein